MHSTKHLKGFLIFAAAAAAALVCLLVFNASTDESDIFSEYPIAHAFGSIDGYTYTNSLEAFELNYSLGHRIFEVDFRFTSDGQVVCWHDWDTSWDGEIPTEEEFLSTKVFGEFTPLSISDVFKLMMEYDDIYIVTDTKYTDTDTVTAEFEAIVEAAEELGAEDVLNRMIVQIYNDEMLGTVKSVYDFDTYIYTLYYDWDGSEETFSHYLEFCTENGIKHITANAYALTLRTIFQARLSGIHLLTHTVNDLGEAKAARALGIENIYTDDITPDDLK